MTLRGERARVLSDLTFAYSFSGPLSTSGGSLTDAVMSYRVSGQFAPDGSASGSVAIASLTFKYDGEAHTCSQNDVTWTAKR